MNSESFQKELIARQSERIEKMKNSEPYFVEFLGKQIIVHRNVFYPSEDTRLLAKNIIIKPNENLLECCSGTGAIAIYLADKAKEIFCTDISLYCIDNIKENMKIHNKKINVYLADLFPKLYKKYNVIVINPPYTNNIAKDLIEQAYWDQDHKTINKFLAEAKNYLVPNGRIYLSWADFANFDLIENLFKIYNYKYKQIAESEYKDNTYRVYELTI